MCAGSRWWFCLSFFLRTTDESQSSVAADNEDDDEGGRVSGFDDSAAEAFLASTRDSFIVAVM
jgi:hypothetical protein